MSMPSALFIRSCRMCSTASGSSAKIPTVAPGFVAFPRKYLVLVRFGDCLRDFAQSVVEIPPGFRDPFVESRIEISVDLLLEQFGHLAGMKRFKRV